MNTSSATKNIIFCENFFSPEKDLILVKAFIDDCVQQKIAKISQKIATCRFSPKNGYQIKTFFIISTGYYVLVVLIHTHGREG